MKTSGIYMIRHKKSGKAYIGRSVDIHTRWSGHKHDATYRRKNHPIHNALRKYGADAFEWTVLAEAPAKDLPLLELQFIMSMKTVAPYGYNVGSTEGGGVSNEIIKEMPLDEQAWRREMIHRASGMGHVALREMRKNPDYEKTFREIKSAASTKREANIRKRRAADPDYDARMRASRVAASLLNPQRNDAKASATFKERMATDPEFAATVRENRARACRVMWQKKRAKKGGGNGDLFGH